MSLAGSVRPAKILNISLAEHVMAWSNAAVALTAQWQHKLANATSTRLCQTLLVTAGTAAVMQALAVGACACRAVSKAFQAPAARRPCCAASRPRAEGVHQAAPAAQPACRSLQNTWCRSTKGEAAVNAWRACSNQRERPALVENCVVYVMQHRTMLLSPAKLQVQAFLGRGSRLKRTCLEERSSS